MSHTWGDRCQAERILVNGEAITISRNLAEGLRALSRYPAVVDGHLKVWNDFLCLDQQNKVEVQRELKRMPTIFSNAYSVVAWLGPAMEESPLVMDTLNKFGDVDDHFARSEEILTSIPREVWKALAYFLQRPYWRRMWIVQELALAGSQTVLLCGDRSAHLHSLWNLVVAIIENVPWFHRLFATSRGDDGSYYDRFRHETFSVCARLLYVHEIDRSIQNGTDCDVLQLLDICRGSLQQDDRDKVYSILGLLPPRVSALIEPDLDKTAHAVYADLARAIIRAMKRLDLLQNCRIRSGKPMFPTWTPDLRVKSMSHTLGTRAIMDAGGNLEIEPRFSPDGLFLICRGVVLDEIDHLTPPQWPLVAVSEEEEMQSVPTIPVLEQNMATVRDALWRTLVGGSAGFPHDTTAPDEYAQLLNLPWPETSDDDVPTMAQNLIDQNWCSPHERQDMMTFLHFRHRATREFDVCGYPLGYFFPTSHDLSSSSASVGTTRQLKWPRKMLRQAANTLKRRRLTVTSQGRLGVAYIDGYLTVEYNLDTGVREKPVMDIDDVFLVLHHHWVLDTPVFPDERQRLQLALLLLLSAYTATRPAALVYKATNHTKQREHYFGWENDAPGNDEKTNSETYILTEVDTLIFDPILLMITVSILDNAFESMNVVDPHSGHSARLQEEIEVPAMNTSVLVNSGLLTLNEPSGGAFIGSSIRSKTRIRHYIPRPRGRSADGAAGASMAANAAGPTTPPRLPATAPSAPAPARHTNRQKAKAPRDVARTSPQSGATLSPPASRPSIPSNSLNPHSSISQTSETLQTSIVLDLSNTIDPVEDFIQLKEIMTIFSNSQSALRVLAKPRQQSGQAIVRDILWRLQRELAHKHAQKATELDRDIPPATSVKSAALREGNTLLNVERTLFEASHEGQYTKQLDRAFPGMHTRRIYDGLKREEAQIVAELRTGKVALIVPFTALGR
ncbi:uncharacterized protein Z518_07717 [Rhinocladiella mackenziei CBS 650.93]|uniref:Rhinocladiella mackenziei CBS 650.93 unplaced genomic scaffold supercont1.5, whole genome shotgun sequence n=1 Tax=Rhinocladiella mackenziei CBS 650.93 TaxID=1442369 RepID=A0A0D2H134_9EURO|nr:uncharacterized protein Z518_07717 [Rhinocladiella mackenziei CBS 650.93]KIX04163.1 hypothetical protein Z518_07717 [Rhinocladiella mackenziei CBS 650.93]